ncbi:MAG: ADP-ribosylglycohydrolase family protein [Oscillochloris sp.]|nr:ADP-ribosylglycohydrolase family protein [Oscillochloris sp.]
MASASEQTAFQRLRSGIPAPESGSIALNGPIVAEQIGAQIFSDGWAMVCPHDPDGAVVLARAAAQVSHDGVAVDAACLLAAMAAAAFGGHDIPTLLQIGLERVSPDSAIARLATELLHIVGVNRIGGRRGYGWQPTTATTAIQAIVM